ncbi:MAG: hypothetical protein QXE05_01120 [Nitrososphaeria archaeon]
MVKIIVKKEYIIKIAKYIKMNWGALFIISFMVLLSMAAIYLSLGNESYANDIAVYAYYMLILGIILQIVSYIKYGNKSVEYA